MTTLRFGKFFLLLLSVVMLMATSSVMAQEETTEETEEAAAPLTQGQAAVILARRLGLFGSDEVPTEARAIQMLKGQGISPKDGWQVDGFLRSGDLARMLVKALGIDNRLTPEQIAGEDDTPFFEILTSTYGLDLSTLGTASDLNTLIDSNADLNQESLDISRDSGTDPLGLPPVGLGLGGGGGGEGGGAGGLITQADLAASLAALAAAEASNRQNITPSAP